MYKIYIYRNIINGKVYVGSTKQSINERYSTGYKGKFREALIEYGREAFKVTILCECKNAKEAQERENHFIDAFDSIKNGYNTLKAGGHKRQQPVKCVETGMIFESCAAAEKYYGGGHKLCKVLDNPNRTYHGFHWISIDE